MSYLGIPNGIFDLNDSDIFVGSYYQKKDIKEILSTNDNDLISVEFKYIDGYEVIDENTIHKLWYNNLIPNLPPINKSSFDELVLIKLIKNVYPNSIVERQVRVGKFTMDLKVTNDNYPPVFIEFDGPSHFTISKWGIPKHNPFRKKYIVEDKTGYEVINWGYWIQKCESNIKTIFDRSIKGYGLIWNSNIHFGDFVFDDSSIIIDTISKRFNCVNDDGYGYYYVNSKGRNNPTHPIISKIMCGKESVDRLLPKGYVDKDYWLPNFNQLSSS